MSRIRPAINRALRRRGTLNSLAGRTFYTGRLLAKGYPISRGYSEFAPGPFFVIGAARSGNTLLRALLTGHSAVGIPPESYVLPNLVEKWEQLSFLRWNDLVRVVIGTFESHPEFVTWNLSLAPVYQTAFALKRADRSLAAVIDLVYRHYLEQRAPGSLLWGDKTPLNTENWQTIDRLYPGARYIHILRDGRDSVCSALEAGLASDLEQGCAGWLLRVRAADRVQERVGSERFIEVRYEDLVVDPATSMERIFQFLELPWEEGSLDHRSGFNELGDTRLRTHHANVARPIFTTSVGKWRRCFTDVQVSTLQQLLGAELSRRGYSSDPTETAQVPD